MGQQTIPVLKEKFADGKTPTGGDFSDVFDSYLHRGTKINQSQVLGLNDELKDIEENKADKTQIEAIENEIPNLATKDDLQSVMAGLRPMGSVETEAELRAIADPNDNDSYFVKETKDENGDPYIWRWDANLNDWVNTKQVVYKDVARAGGSNKTVQQLDAEKADRTITLPSIISDRTNDIGTWSNGNNEPTSLVTYNYESQVFGKKELVTKVVDNVTAGSGNQLMFAVVFYYPNEQSKIAFGDRIGIAFNFYSPIDTTMLLTVYPNIEGESKTINIKQGINFINYEYQENAYGNDRQLTIKMPVTGETFYIQRALVYKGYYKNTLLADYPTKEDVILQRQAPIVPINIISERTNDIGTWSNGNNEPTSLVTYNYESQVFGKKELVTKVVDNVSAGSDIQNQFCIVFYLIAEKPKITLGDSIGVAFNFYSPIDTTMLLTVYPNIEGESKTINIKQGINFINYEYQENAYGNDRQLTIKMPVTGETFYIQRAISYRGILSNPDIPVSDSSALSDIQCFGDSLTAQNYAQYITQITGRLATPYGYGGKTSTYIRDKFFELADTSKTQIIWVGRNNLLNIDSIVNDIRAMVDYLGHNRFIVCNPPNGNESDSPYAEGKNDDGNLVYQYVVELENRLRNEYQDNFLDIRKAIVNGWNMGNVRLLSSFTQPNIGDTVQISVSDATFLTSYNQSDLAEWGTAVMNYVRIGFIGSSDKYEVVSKDSDTLLTVRLTEANRIQPGSLVQNMPDAGSADSIIYLNVFQNADLKSYQDDRPLSTFRSDNVHYTDGGLRYIAKVMSRKIETLKI